MADSTVKLSADEVDKATAAAVIPVSLGRYHDKPALYIASDVLARVISAVVAVVIIVGMLRLAFEANDRFFVPDAVRPLWFRVSQLVLAAATFVAAGVEVAYLGYYSMWGLIWRRFRGVSLAFAVLASAWTILWLVDRFVLDAVFLDWTLA